MAEKLLLMYFQVRSLSKSIIPTVEAKATEGCQPMQCFGAGSLMYKDQPPILIEPVQHLREALEVERLKSADKHRWPSFGKPSRKYPCSFASQSVPISARESFLGSRD